MSSPPAGTHPIVSLEHSIAALGAFGATAAGGVDRPAWSAALRDAYDWLAHAAAGVGLATRLDAAGNLVVVWEGPAGPALVVGSHLDSVPDGGRYDGALGVLSGLHAIARLRADGLQPTRPVWLVAFMDEEGARFGTTMFGSRAFAGEDVSECGERADGDGVTLAQAMRTWDRDIAAAGNARAIDQVAAYLELHIEQGPVLERDDAGIGIVSAIVGLVTLRVRLCGRAAHAGTTPMDARRDAAVGAARLVLGLRDELRRGGRHAVGTVGVVQTVAGASNVVPGTVELTVDLRAADAGDLAANEAWLRSAIADIAHEEGLEAGVEVSSRLAPLELDRGIGAVLEEAARRAGAPPVRLASGAGHDAMVIGRHVPAGMLFVPSVDGVSHSPRELTRAEDCERGVDVLARAIAALAG